jgi:uncharacterized repeat protein (TIGR04076 family)
MDDKLPKIVARVISQKGTCEFGHKIGDEFFIGQTTPAGMCSWAFYTLFPFAQALQWGGSFPWEKDPDKTTVACPDPANPVVFELRRVQP